MGKYAHFNDINKVKGNAIKLFLLSLVLMAGVSLFAIKNVTEANKRALANAYLLHKGNKVPLESIQSNERSVDILVKGHLNNYHDFMFSLEPNIRYIKGRIEGKALHMVDDSGDRFYHRLVDDGFYSDVAMRGYRYVLNVDSIKVDYGRYPFSFKLYATQRINKGTNNYFRALETTGRVKEVAITQENLNGLEIIDFIVQRNEPIKK